MARRHIAFFALALVASSQGYTDDSTSVSPYIDHLKSQMPENKQQENPQRTDDHPDPYIQAVKSKIGGGTDQPTEATQPYIDKERAKNPGLAPEPDSNYTADKQAQLGPDQMSGAIQAVNENRSELHMKRNGDVNGSFGVTVGASPGGHSYTGTTQYVAQPFANCYGTNWAPDLTFFGEYKIWKFGSAGNLGVFGSGEFSINKGNGTYEIQLYQADGSAFPKVDSLVHLSFVTIPVTVGLKYDVMLGRYFQPFADVGPTLIGMSESRDDGVNGNKVLSKGFTVNAGVNLLMDTLFGENAWSLYQDFNIKHMYFTIEYTNLSSISSPVDVSYSGVSGGFSFEF